MNEYILPLNHKINVTGIRLYAFHGCLEEEARIGGEYKIDVEITTDFTEAMHNDDLSETIDYVVVHRIVREEMQVRSKLIEHVAKRIILRFKKEIKKEANYHLTIRKIAPPIDGDVEFVSVSVQSD